MCDDDFSSVYDACDKVSYGKFYKLNGYLFRVNKLYKPNSFMCELLVKEAYVGGLIWHFGIKIKDLRNIVWIFLLA